MRLGFCHPQKTRGHEIYEKSVPQIHNMQMTKVLGG